VLVGVLSLALPIAAVAQAPERADATRPEGRARGVVLDDDGAALAGARVRLVPVAKMGEEPDPQALDAAGGPQPPNPVLTKKDGTWSFAFLEPGVWWISVEAEGFRPAKGWLQVPAHGPGERLRIQLQDLDVVTPRYAEDHPDQSVRDWLADGDALLEQGHAASARAEYEKALATPGVLGPADRAAVLETVARTHYLEGDVDAAARALEAALVLAPDDQRAHQLLTALLQGRNRGAEAERFFKRLAKEPDALSAELADLVQPPHAPDDGDELPDEPLLAPERGRLGRYRVAFTEPGPFADVQTFLDRYGADRQALEAADPSKKNGGEIDLAHESFEVLVPESYGSSGASGGAAAEGAEGTAGAGLPWGLVVWVSPGAYGATRKTDVHDVLSKHHLLWVGANRSGNERFTWDRVALAVAAANNMRSLYDLAPERIYVAGYSGGGRMASALAMLFPEVFRGGILVVGADFYRPIPVPDRPGTHWPASFQEPPKKTLQEVEHHSRFALLTGTRDFNRAQIREVYRAMEDAGFQHVTYLEVPGGDHYMGLPPDWLERAIEALDRPLE